MAGWIASLQTQYERTALTVDAAMGVTHATNSVIDQDWVQALASLVMGAQAAQAAQAIQAGVPHG